MIERRPPCGERRRDLAAPPCRNRFPLPCGRFPWTALRVLAFLLVFPVLMSGTLPAQNPGEERDGGQATEFLRYRHYYTPRTWVTDFLAGEKLYLPVRPEEFQRWIDLLQSEGQPPVRVSPSGDRLARCVLVATFSENRLIDGTGQFEFRPQKEPVSPASASATEPARIDFSPLGIWIGDPRWTDGSPADILTASDGRTTLREYAAATPKLYPASLAAGITGPGLRELHTRILRNTGTTENVEGTDTPDTSDTTENTEATEAPASPTGTTVRRNLHLPSGDYSGVKLPLEFLLRDPPARLLPARLAAGNSNRSRDALTFQWSLSGQDDPLGNHVFQFALPPSLTLELRLAVPESLRPVCPGALVFEETGPASPLHKAGTLPETTERLDSSGPASPEHSETSKIEREQAARGDFVSVAGAFSWSWKLLGLLTGTTTVEAALPSTPVTPASAETPGSEAQSVAAEVPNTPDGPVAPVLRHWRIVAAGHAPLKLLLSPEDRARNPHRSGFRQNQAWSLTMQGLDVTAGFVFDRPLSSDGRLLVELEAPLRPIDVRYGGRSVPWSTVETLSEDGDVTATTEESEHKTPSEPAARAASRRILIHLDGIANSDAQELQIDAQSRLPLETFLTLPRIRIVSDRFFHRETRAALVVVRPLLVRHIKAVDAARTVPGSALERTGREVFVYQYFHADARLQLELTTFVPKLHCAGATVLESSPGEIAAETTVECSLTEGHRYGLQCPVASGWVVDSVKATGRNEVLDWNVDEKTRLLSVQWKRPLVPGEPLRLQVKSRLPVLPDTLTLQALQPLRLPGTESEGHLLGIDPTCPYHFQEGVSIPYLLTVPASVPSALRTVLDHSGAAILPVNGGTRLLPLALESSRSSFQAEIYGAVTLKRDEAKLVYTLRCTPVEGYMDRLLVVFCPEDEGQWQWQMDEEGERPFQVLPVSYRPPSPPPGLFDPVDDPEAPTSDDPESEEESGTVPEADTAPAPGERSGDDGKDEVAAPKTFRAWELHFTSPRSAPFQISVSRNLSNIPPGGQVALPLAALPLAAEQRGELVVEANPDPGVRIVNHRLESLPFSPRARLVESRLDTPVSDGPRNVLQTVRAVFRYDPRKELDHEESPGLLLISTNEPPATVSRDPGSPPDPHTAALDGCVWSVQLDSQYQSDGTVRNNAIFLIENVGREAVSVTLPEQVDAAEIMAVWVDDSHVGWTPEVPTQGTGGVRLNIDLPPGRRFVALSVEYLHHDEPLTRKRRLRPSYPRIDMPVLSGSWTTWFPPEYDVSERRKPPGTERPRLRIRAMQWGLGDLDSLSPRRWYRAFVRNEDDAVFRGLAQTLLAAVGEPERIVGAAVTDGQGAASHSDTGSSRTQPTWAQWFEREDRLREDFDAVVPHVPVRFQIDRRSLHRIGMNASRTIPRDGEGSAQERGYRALEKSGLSLILLKGGDPTTSEACTVLLTSSLTAAKCRGMLKNLIGERVWLLEPSSETERQPWGRGAAPQPGPSWESLRQRLPKECEWVEPALWIRPSVSENTLWPSVSQEVRFSSATAGWTAIELSRGDAERALYIVHRNTIATYGMIAFLGMLLLTWRRPLSHPLALLGILFLLEMATRNVPPCYAPLSGGAFFGTLCSLAFSLIRPVARHRLNRGRVLANSSDTTAAGQVKDGTSILDDTFDLGPGEGGLSDGQFGNGNAAAPGSTVIPAANMDALPVPEPHKESTGTRGAAGSDQSERSGNSLAQQETVISNGLSGIVQFEETGDGSGQTREGDDKREEKRTGDDTDKPRDTGGGAGSSGSGKPWRFPLSLAAPLLLLALAATSFVAQGQTVSRTMQNTPPYSPSAATTPGSDSATFGAASTEPQTSPQVSPGTPGPGGAQSVPPNAGQETRTVSGAGDASRSFRDVAPPEPYKVVIPTENGVEVDENYWISEEFLRKIHDAIRQGSTSGYRWSIRRAEYVGTLADNPLQQQEILNLRALYDIELENGTATLQVPFLPEVVRWDGNPIQPTGPAPVGEGVEGGPGAEMMTFAVENQRPGEHRLEIVRLHMADRNEEFNRLQLQNITIPKVPGAVLRLTVPPETPPIHVGLSQGAVYPNSVYSPQLVAELGAVDQIRLSWSDRTLLEERMTTDQLFLLRAQPNKEVELQAKFRFHAGNAKVRHLYVEIDPDLQISGQYRLFVNAQPSDLVESVRELSDDGLAPAARRGLTRVTLKEPTGGTITLRADFVVKNFSGIGSMVLPRLHAAHTRLGKSWMAVSVDPALEATFHPEIADPEILRSFPALWAATGVSPTLQEIPLHIAFDLKNVEEGTLLSIRGRKPVYKTHWEQSLLFDETEIRVEARAKIEATTDTFQHTLRVPAEMDIEELNILDAEGQPLEARWIPASARDHSTDGPADKGADKTVDKSEGPTCEYAVFLKRPINGLYFMTVRGRLPFRLPDNTASSAIPLPRLGLVDALLLDESLALYRTSGVVFSFETLPPVWRKLAADRTEPVFPKAVPLGVYSSLSAPPPTVRPPREAGHTPSTAPGTAASSSQTTPPRPLPGSRTGRPAGPPSPGPSASLPSFVPLSPEAVETSAGHPKTAAHRGAQAGLVPPAPSGPGISETPPFGSNTSGPGTPASSPARARGGAEAVPRPPVVDPGPTELPTFQLRRNHPRITGTQVTSLYRRLRRADNHDERLDGASSEAGDLRTERETVWEVLTIFDLTVEGGEIDLLSIRFDKECRAISVLGNHGYLIDPRESGPVMQLKPSPPASQTLRLEIRCEVGSLADSVTLPKIALDAERVAVRQYVVLPREFLAERYDWSVEQLSPVSPQTAQWILADEAVFQREEIDRTDPESLEDHRRTKTVYAVVGPDYEAVIRPPGEGAVVLLADLDLYLRKDGTLYGIATYDIRGGGEKRATLRMPEGFRAVRLSSGSNAFETSPDGKRRRYLIELWETLPQRVELVFEGEIPALRRSPATTLRRWTREPIEMEIPLPRFEEMAIRETLWTLNFEASARDSLPRILTRAFVRLPKESPRTLASESSPASGIRNGSEKGTALSAGSETGISPPPEPGLRLVTFEAQTPRDEGTCRAALLLFDLARLENLLRCSETLSVSATPSHADLQAWHSRWGRCWWTLRDETAMRLAAYGEGDSGQPNDRISLADDVRSPVLSYLASLETAQQPEALLGDTRVLTGALRHLDAKHRTVLENLALVIEDGHLEKDLTHATRASSIWSMSHFGGEARLFGGVGGELAHLQLVSQPVPSRFIDSVPFHYGIWALILALAVLVVNDTPVRRLYRRFPHFWGGVLALLLWGVYPQSSAGPFLLALVLLAMLSSPWRKTSPNAEPVVSHWKPS